MTESNEIYINTVRNLIKPPTDIKKIDEAINKLSVLIFKNQNINDDEQVRFTRYFGEIEASGKKSNITKAKDRRLSADLADVSNLDKNNTL